MKFIIHVFILALLWLGSLAYAKNGHLFNIVESGDPVLLDINLCLNGKAPHSCQKYRVSATNLSLTTTPKHDYPAAGIKVLSTNYKPSNCRPILNGYCLFSANHSQATLIKLNNLQIKEQKILLNSVPPAMPTVGDTYTLTATGGGSGNPVVFSIDAGSSSGACTISGNEVSFTAVGTCIVNANQAGNAQYNSAPQVQQKITVNKKEQNIAWISIPPVTPTVGDAYTLTATGGGSGNPVVFSIDAGSTSGACTLSGNEVSFNAVGTCIVNANQAGNAQYNTAPQVQQNVAINKQEQSITWTSTPPVTPTVGDTYTLTATGGGSGNPVVFSIDAGSTSGTCTLTDDTVSFTAGGTCIVNANQAGNAQYNAAPQVQQNVTINKQEQSITWTSTPPVTPTVGDTYTLTATGGGSGHPVVFSIDASSTSGACTLSDSTVSFTAGGTCIVNANQAGNAQYNAAPQMQQNVTINKQEQSITWTSTPPVTSTVGDTYTLTATGGGSGNPLVFSIDASSTSGACTLTDDTVSFTAGGTCIVNANQAGNAQYNAAPQVQQNMTVNKLEQSITWTSTPPTMPTIGDTYTLTATGGGSGNPVVFSIDAGSTSGACTLSGNEVSFNAVGTCIVNADLAGDAQYNAAPQVQQNMTINKQEQSITWSSTPPITPTVGDTYTLTATGGGSGNPVVFSIDASSTSGACTLTDDTVSFTAGGTCIVNANQAGNAQYNAAPQVQQNVTINKQEQSITWTSTPPVTPTVGDTYTLTATGGGSGNPVVFSIDASSTSGACTLSDSTVSFTAGGTCIVNANQAGNAQYNAAPQMQQNVTINKQEQSITWTSTPPITPTVGDTYTLTATGGGSGNPLVFSIDAGSTSGACTLTDDTVSFIAGGTCIVNANQAGNAQYNAAPQVQQNMTVNKLEQSITWTSTPPTMPTIGDTYTLTATGGGSGNPLVFSIDASSTSGACTLTDDTVSFTAVGTCIVNADQAGDAQYNAAAQMQQNISVKLTQTIVFSSSPPSSITAGGTYSVAATGGASGNPVVFSIDAGSTSGACTISGNTVFFTAEGTCIVNADQAGDNQYYPASQVQQNISVGAAIAVPSPPTSVIAIPGDGQVTLNWSAPLYPGSAPITGYIVTYGDTSTSSYNTIVADCNPTTAQSCVVTGLTNGTSYTFRVSASNSSGYARYWFGYSSPVIPLSGLAISPSTLALSGLGSAHARKIKLINNLNYDITLDAIPVDTAFSPALPTGTTLSNTTCNTVTPLIAKGGSCEITITPDSTVSTNDSGTLCTLGVAPKPSVLTVTANSGTVHAEVNVVVLGYGCQYQGGYIFSIDDTTVVTRSIGGKVVAYKDQTSRWWMPIINGGYPYLVSIWGIDEGSSYLNPSPNASSSMPAELKAGQLNCNGNYDGACNSNNIITVYYPEQEYAAAICNQPIDSLGNYPCITGTCYTDWYLPSICEMDSVGFGYSNCPSDAQSMTKNLLGLIGNYSNSCSFNTTNNCIADFHWSSTQLSSNTQDYAWFEYFYNGGGYQSNYNNKPNYFLLRCVRSLTY